MRDNGCGTTDANASAEKLASCAVAVQAFQVGERWRHGFTLVPFAERALWNVPRSVRNQSTFAPESLTTLAHFSVSLAKKLAKSMGEPGSGVPPNSAIRAFIFGSAKAELSS